MLGVILARQTGMDLKENHEDFAADYRDPGAVAVGDAGYSEAQTSRR